MFWTSQQLACGQNPNALLLLSASAYVMLQKLTDGCVLQGNVASRTKGFDDKVASQPFAASRTASQPILLTATFCIMPAVERMLLVLTLHTAITALHHIPPAASLPCPYPSPA